MSSQDRPPSSSDPGYPPLDPRTSSGSRMSVAQLAPSRPHFLPPPPASAYPARPVLPPIHPRSSFTSDAAYFSSVPGSLGYPRPSVGAFPQSLQQPSNIQWQAIPPLERQPRSQPGVSRDLPLPSGSSYLLPVGGIRPPLDQRASRETSSEVSSTPTSARRDSRFSVGEEARYNLAPLVERPGRRDSGSSYPGSATSSSPFSSVLSYSSQQQPATGFQPTSNDV